MADTAATPAGEIMDAATQALLGQMFLMAGNNLMTGLLAANANAMQGLQVVNTSLIQQTAGAFTAATSESTNPGLMSGLNTAAMVPTLAPLGTGK